MFPWFWFFAPQLHFPFGGSVAQRIQPDTQCRFGRFGRCMTQRKALGHAPAYADRAMGAAAGLLF
jgi:hypothetical protein